MCGIIGYVGHRAAVPVAIEGLRLLEYRGYDSAGVAYAENGNLVTVRAKGKLCELEEKLKTVSHFSATTAIGHTRWATHGAPEERNAHPHLGGKKGNQRIAIVHNGIFENYREIKEELLAKGYEFTSDTDTEVMAHLIADEAEKNSTLLEAFACALRRARGAYAVVMMSLDEPDVLYAARLSSPLILGIGVGENFLASDVPAFLSYTQEVVFLENHEIVTLTPDLWTVYDLENLNPIEKQIRTIKWNIQSAQKSGYRHFMLKEIFEQPKVITDCLTGRILLDGESEQADMTRTSVKIPELDDFPIPEHLHIVACGTSLHAGMWARDLFERWAGITSTIEIASEFHCRSVRFRKGDAVLVISQSGETADTKASLVMAKQRGCPVLAICNVVGSSIAREADAVLYTQAGPEISVASTKAMCSQMIILTLMAMYYGTRTGLMKNETKLEVLDTLRSIPSILENTLAGMRGRAQTLARRFSHAQSFFYLGRGMSYPLALEGALKLKEISYIHAEGYAAGEMKHGPIALIDPTFPTFALALDDELLPKVISNMQEIKARGGEIIALVQSDAPTPADEQWRIPPIKGFLAGLVALPALQLFSYEVSVLLGKDVDQPRNLAKSVTVE